MICKQFVVSYRLAATQLRGGAKERTGLPRTFFDAKAVKIERAKKILRIGIVVAGRL